MKTKKNIYLDFNATTPVDNRVLEEMLPFFTEKFGNASSDHFYGWDAGEAVENAREQVSRLVNAKATEITFTSGATEAANLALFGFCTKNRQKGNHIISCRTEHKAVLQTLEALQDRGFQVTYLDVDREGNIDLVELEDSIKPETILVCLMLANNETGLIHPLKEISEVVHRHGVKLMSDITQAVGKIPVNLKELAIDLAIFSSHKIYGPKGIGALYINRNNKTELDPVIFGGAQEKKLRPGTLNVPGIVGFGKASEIVYSEMDGEMKRIKNLRSLLEELLGNIEGSHLNSQNSPRLPNTTNITFKDIDGSRLLRNLNMLAVSRGSACTSNIVKPSHVLKAMGLSDELALSSLRISLGKSNTVSDIESAAGEIGNAVKGLKKISI
ncbi:cysteine desulfurase [Salinimicrobium sp. CDJ15-81-2]|nr:cysteine desulfurase [Salinimicrobium nanhaiense]